MNDASWQGPSGFIYPREVKEEIIHLPNVSFTEKHIKWVFMNKSITYMPILYC